MLTPFTRFDETWQADKRLDALSGDTLQRTRIIAMRPLQMLFCQSGYHFWPFMPWMIRYETHNCCTS